MKKERSAGIDVFKAIAIIMVVTLHLGFWNGDFIAVPMLKTYLQYCFRLIAEGVPLFVFVNGYLLLSRNTYSIKKHYIKTAKFFLLLILWSILLVIAGNALSLAPEALSFTMIARYVLQTQVGAQYTGVLWFLQNLIAVYLVYPALKALFDREYRLFTVVFGFIAFFTVGIHSIELVRDLLGTVTDVSLLNDVIGFLYRFSSFGNAYYLYYFMLGGIAYKQKEKILQFRSILAAAAVPAWAMACVIGILLSSRMQLVYNRAFNYGSVFMTVILLGVFALTFPIEGNNAIIRIMAYIGRNTMSIYLLHFFFIFLMNAYTQSSGVGIRLIFFLFAIVGSCAIGEVLKKIPYLKGLL